MSLEGWRKLILLFWLYEFYWHFVDPSKELISIVKLQQGIRISSLTLQLTSEYNLFKFYMKATYYPLICAFSDLNIYNA